MVSILVLGEHRDGKLKKATLEALGAARSLAASQAGRVSALLVGEGGEALAADCGRYGADEVLMAAGEAFQSFAPEAWRDALLAAIEASGAEVVLAAATPLGFEVMGRAAARLDVGVLSDVVSLEQDGGGLLARRPIYAGKAVATARLVGRPGFATLRPNVFTAAEAARPGTPRALAVKVDPVRARVLRVEKAAAAELDVAEADVVVAFGRGLKGPENFSLVQALARTLGGAVGASRAVVDAGWIAHSHQVGQTGKTVSPKLYVALGISGAIQHLAGMSSSKVIVAVNKDADAPIFKNATYGIVGDLFEIVPALQEALAEYRARHG